MTGVGLVDAVVQAVGASLTYGDPYDRTTVRRRVKSLHALRISTRTFDRTSDPYVRSDEVAILLALGIASAEEINPRAFTGKHQ